MKKVVDRVVGFFNKLYYLVPHDKSLHIILGLVIYFIASLFLSIQLSFLMVVCGGFIKEFLVDNLSTEGVVDLKDIWFTILGGILGALIDYF